MLITNGFITRNIEAKQLPEYKAKGYAVVETAQPKAEPKLKAEPKRKKAGEN